MEPKKAIIFQHLQIENLGTFAPILKECGYNYTYVLTPDTDLSDIDTLAYDLLIIMGGSMGVYETDKHPYIAEEIDIVKRHIDSKKPVLGICLGAQIIAASLDADVYPGSKGKEIGWYPLTITKEGMETPIRHLGGENTNMFHWHGDTFDLPKGASLLASSKKYKNQIFSLENHKIMALQCHPEIDESHFSACFKNFTNDLGSENQEQKMKEIERQTGKYSSILLSQNRLFMSEWLKRTIKNA